jgi:hypothetical protein
MSDYLDRLTRQSSGSEAAIRPRLSARFEPTEQASTLDLEAEAELPGTEAERGQANTLQPPAQPPIETGGRPVTNAGMHRPSLLALPMPLPELIEMDDATSRQAEQSVQTAVAAKIELTHVAQIQTTPLVGTSPAGGHERLAANAERSILSTHSNLEQTAPPATTVKVDSPVPMTWLNDRRPSERAQGAATLRPGRVVQPQVLPAPEPTAPPKNRTAELQASPVIRVTIGRVEVRAIMPPPAAPARRSAPSAPQLSLEEYLRRRNGGQP